MSFTLTGRITCNYNNHGVTNKHYTIWNVDDAEIIPEGN